MGTRCHFLLRVVWMVRTALYFFGELEWELNFNMQ